MSTTSPKHVVVIGSGIIGLCSAFELLNDGNAVTVLDRGAAGGRHGASYGHGCWISPASVVPMSMPGLWRKVPGYLFDSNGPLVIRWRHLPTLLPWLLRFVRAGSTKARVERTAKALSFLLKDAPERHRMLAQAISKEVLIRQDGLLYAFPDRAAFEAEAFSWQLRKSNGVVWEELDSDILHAREPMLAKHYKFGVFVARGGNCSDPASYLAGIADNCTSRGASFVRSGVAHIEIDSNEKVAVTTDSGARIVCDRVVIAAGIHSKALATEAGDCIPLESERGYHGVIADPKVELKCPVMPSDGKMANTLTVDGLRLSGQVELANVDAPADWSRVDILLDHAKKAYPSLQVGAQVDRWMGHRPSTPDGLPVIGYSSRSKNVVYAFGHGHIGFASGPITGCIVAKLVRGEQPGPEISAYSPRRFA